MCGSPLVANARPAHTPPPAEFGSRPVAAFREVGSPATFQRPATRREEISEAVPVTSSSPAEPPSPDLASGTRFAPLAPPAPASRPVPRNADVSPSVITGPSFLGLNRPAAGRTSGRSDDLDYLLEDEEPRRGWGKLIAIAVALVLLGGFGYLRWKQGGFDFVTKGLRPADSTSQAGPEAASAPNASDAAGSGGAASSNPVIPTDASSTPSPSTTESPTTESSTKASSNPPATQAGANPQTPPNSNAATATPAPPERGSASTTDSAASAADNNAKPKADENAATAQSNEPAPLPKPTAPVRKIREPKPSPVTVVDGTAEAERYIYGRGVRQDCDEGLRLLKPAAQTNPKAMITLGSLYSSGTCTPRDLPTAYRWYAMALHKQPDNATLQDDLKQLWGQMTPPERQLAIRLSQ